MKKVALLLVIGIFVVLASHNLNAQTQTISVDTTISADCEFYPFNTNDAIFGLSVTGSVNLYSDMSLIRIVLYDTLFNEFLVYEAYPLIATQSSFNIYDVCDETCYLNGVGPYSIEVQIIEADLTINDIIISNNTYDNMDSLRYDSKRMADQNKIQIINNNIDDMKLAWAAGDNEIVQKYYTEKKTMFGNKYNYRGFDYYSGGIFDLTLGQMSTRSDLSILDNFDWRNRHNAHIEPQPGENHPYHDGSIGWLTEPKKQECKHCWVFAPLHATEAIVNLYFNQQIDIDLSEQELASCVDKYDNCDGGSAAGSFNYLLNYGVVSESCFGYDPFADSVPDVPPSAVNVACDTDLNCGDPFEIKITNKVTIPNDEEEIKKAIINMGPIVCLVDSWWHFIVVAGFGQIKDGDTVRTESSQSDSIVVTEDNEYSHLIGKTYWIFKNSLGNDWGDNGFGKIFSPLSEFSKRYYIESPIIAQNYDSTDIKCLDYDNDGYFNWGIGDKPENCPGDCHDSIDSHDDNPRIGPFDENYYGTPVAPVMHVSQGGQYIPNNNFYNFFDENLQTGQEIVLTFEIKNTGNAQLNLLPASFGTTVELSGPHEADFAKDLTGLETTIPMDGGTTTFDIKFKLNAPANEAKIVKVTVNLQEDDMVPYVFTLVFSDCDYTPTYEIVNSDTTWSGQLLKFTDVKVSSGATLTVTGDVAFSSGAGLHIEQGGRVIVDGGHLTSLCNSLWKGVDVWATNIKHHQFDPSTQAYIKLMNGGKISNAETGIETARFNGATMINNTHGGIVIISDGIIENCEVGVHLFPYRNYNPVTLQPMDDLSHFSQTEFVNDKFRAPAKQLWLDKVDGIKIRGCSFEYNNIPGPLTTPIGIFSANSGYTVTYYNISQTTPPSEILPTTFKTLDYGIYATDRSTFKQIRIDNTRFEDNIKGVYMSAVNYPVIIENEFLVRSRFSPIPESLEMIGLYLNDESVGFVVEENKFYSDIHQSRLDNIVCQGITLNHTGQQPNEIYNNSFSNLSDGIIAAGENRDALGAGLCIKCNDFTNILRDVSVIPGKDEDGDYITSGPTIGIAENQGIQSNGSNNALAAGNTFSEDNTELGVINYQNEVSWNDIDYLHHKQQSTNSKIRPQPISADIDRIEDQDADYTKEESCPSHYGGGGIEVNTATASFNAEINTTNAYSDTLGLLVDGGDTHALTVEVNTSTEQESTELRQELLDESPYLSDTILKAAIKKEDVLPNAMVRDVLVANPQSAKSDEVLMALGHRSDTMPGYMVEQILQGGNYYGAKELLEQKLTASRTRKGTVMNDLMHHYLKDTSDLQTSNDSIQALLRRDIELESKYRLVMRHIGMRDSASAFGLMSDIPVNFDLSTSEEIEYELYEDFVNLQWQILTDSTLADSLFVDELFNLYQAGLTAPCFYARNMLIGLGEISYEPPVYLPGYSKATEGKYFEWGSRASENKWMKLFPNPAGSYFTIEYDLTSFEGKPNIKILNLSGLPISEFSLSNLKDQIIISTENYIQGFYLVQIEINGRKIDTDKISIIK